MQHSKISINFNILPFIDTDSSKLEYLTPSFPHHYMITKFFDLLFSVVEKKLSD